MAKKPTIMYKAICLLCGKEYEVRGVSVRNGTSQCCKSCSKSMSRKGKKIKNNIYVEKEDYYEMMLKNNKIVKFDKEDFNLINKYFWNITNTNYVYTRYMGKWIYMHRLIMQKELNNKPQLDIDHINHNRAICSYGCSNKYSFSVISNYILLSFLFIIEISTI